jgi:hypothetical protein
MSARFKLLPLTCLQNLDEYPWGDRHSPTSWQGYYRKNKNEIDRRVKKYLQKYPPVFRDGHGAYVAYREASIVSSCPSITTIRLDDANEDEGNSRNSSGQCTWLFPFRLHLILTCLYRRQDPDEPNDAP